MSKLKQLRATTDLHTIAGLLGYQPKMLSYLLYIFNPATKYTKFQIPKSSGGIREIAAPNPQLKLLQHRLSDLLQNCVQEIAESTKLEDRASHGFTRNRSIFTNAQVHRRRRWVLNVDIANFFGSINFGRVRGYFIRSKDFALHPAVATVIAQIACHENALPQGSPSSPVISNLIGRILDIRLIRLARFYSCSYSRYADDLTFSTNRRVFPLALAHETQHRWHAGTSLTKVLTETGFELNQAKTRMQYRTSRQEVTGLVVNLKINIRCEYRRRVRSMVHHLIKTGAFEIDQQSMDSQGNVAVRKGPGDIEQIHGMLGFIDAADRLNKKSSAEVKGTGGLTSREETYRQFLLYKEFYAATMPVVLCEGKTDNVYLVHAIRQLSSQFPQLVEIQSPSKPKLKLRFYKYSRSSTSRLLGLGGGTPHLKPWMSSYLNAVKQFKAPGKTNPIIVVVDHDQAGKEIINYAKGINKLNVNSALPYLHVRENLYVVALPLTNGATSASIEDCFDASTLSMPLDGKILSLNDPIDEKIHISKHVFAQKVVTPNAGTINFSGFIPLLFSISAVIADHSSANILA